MTLNAAIDDVFAYLDDFKKLSGHMEKPSAMMMGATMNIQTDDRQGRTVGSMVKMRGNVLGVHLSLDEVVTEREPPCRKAWETVDCNLFVIGSYRLGFDLSSDGPHTRARIYIAYGLPEKRTHRWLGLLFGRAYARWCIARMALDAQAAFRDSKAGS